MKYRLLLLSFVLGLCLMQFCSKSKTVTVEKPQIITGEQWRDHEPVGYEAHGRRINLHPGESFQYELLELTVKGVRLAKNNKSLKNDIIDLEIKLPGQVENKSVPEKTAFSLMNYRIAVLASHNNPGELGLTEFEICNLSDVPAEIVQKGIAGSAASRARILHNVDRITIHHTGDAKPVPYDCDAAGILRHLQKWGEESKNWWDVPYHYIIGPDGKIYEGRNVRYMGETNTEYDPFGHLSITALGNFEIQKPTAAQIESIVNLTAWLVQEYKVPLTQICGHRDMTSTTVCPGDSLYQYLTDGSLVEMVRNKLSRN